MPNASYCSRLPAYLLFFKQLEDVVCVTDDGHLLFQHRLQHGKPVTYLERRERNKTMLESFALHVKLHQQQR